MRGRACLVGLSLVALSVPACSKPGVGSSPSVTTGHLDSVAVAAAVNTYFGSALADGDWERLARLSIGPLRVQAGWLASQDIGSSPTQGSVSIQRSRVISVKGSAALVAFDATRTVEDRITTYGGPVRLVKANGMWRVADYTRNGRSVAASIFPHVTGSARHGGVIVKVVGAQLGAGNTDVWVRIMNTTSARLVWNRPVVIVDRMGRQLGRGALFVSSNNASEGFLMMPQVSVFGDFAVDNATLPTSTKSFTLVVGATNASTHLPVDLSVTVRL